MLSNQWRTALLSSVEAGGFGFLVWAVPVLGNAQDWPPALETVVVLFLAGVGFGILRPAQPWICGLLLGSGGVATILVRLVIDVIRDPTSHNLWPLEVVFAFVLGAPPSIAGVQIGRHLRAARAVGLVLLSLCLGIVAFSFVGTRQEMAQNEARALKNIRLLTTAVGKFGCDFLQGSDAFTWAGLDAKDCQHLGGGNISCGAYLFRASCRGSSFVLEATPSRMKGGPKLRSFCSDQSGVIRFASRGEDPINEGHPCSDNPRAF